VAHTNLTTLWQLIIKKKQTLQCIAILFTALLAVFRILDAIYLFWSSSFSSNLWFPFEDSCWASLFFHPPYSSSTKVEYATDITRSNEILGWEGIGNRQLCFFKFRAKKTFLFSFFAKFYIKNRITLRFLFAKQISKDTFCEKQTCSIISRSRSD
jgi:hypothetical protein